MGAAAVMSNTALATAGDLPVMASAFKKAVEAGRARYVFLAENADPAVIEPIVLLCRSKEVQTAWVPSMAVLGRACGIEVGAAAAAVVD